MTREEYAYKLEELQQRYNDRKLICDIARDLCYIGNDTKDKKTKRQLTALAILITEYMDANFPKNVEVDITPIEGIHYDHQR